MIAQRVVHVVDLHAHLREKGFEPTDHTTKTGRFWQKDDKLRWESQWLPSARRGLILLPKRIGSRQKGGKWRCPSWPSGREIGFWGWPKTSRKRNVSNCRDSKILNHLMFPDIYLDFRRTPNETRTRTTPPSQDLSAGPKPAVSTNSTIRAYTPPGNSGGVFA